MNDGLETIIADTASTVTRTVKRLRDLQAEVDLLKQENTKLRFRLQKAQRTIQRMEEGEL